MSTGTSPSVTVQVVPWWQDKSFWVSIVNAVILIVSMIRGVPVTQSVENKVDSAAAHAQVAAKQTKATAEKVGAPVEAAN